MFKSGMAEQKANSLQQYHLLRHKEQNMSSPARCQQCFERRSWWTPT